MGVPITLTSPIDRVLIYPTGAQVIRTIRFTAPEAGVHTFDVLNIPICGSEGLNLSIQTPNVTVLDVNWSSRPETKESYLQRYPTAAQLYEELKSKTIICTEIEAKRESRLDIISAYREKLKSIACSDLYRRSCYLDKTSLDSLKIVKESNVEVYDFEVVIDKLRAEILILIGKIDEILGGKSGPWPCEPGTFDFDTRNRILGSLLLDRTQLLSIPRQVNVSGTLSAGSAGSIEGNLMYSVEAARWTPSVELRFTGDSVLTLKYYAQIIQTTGHSWDSVSVSLSTCNQIRPVFEPKVKPDVIMLVPRLPPAPKARMMGRAAIMMCADEVESGGPPKMEMVSDTTTSQAMFHIPKQCTIPSNPKGSRFLITQANLEAVSIRYLAPEISDTVYINTQVKNTSEFFIMACEAEIFADNAFLHKTWIPGIATNQKINICCGVDSEIKVYNSGIRKKRTRTGRAFLPRTNDKVIYSSESTIQSFHKEAVVVVVVFRVPTTTDSTISVAIETPTVLKNVNADHEFDVVLQENSIDQYNWFYNLTTNCAVCVLRLEPGESSLINYAYSVTHPAAKPIRVHAASSEPNFHI